MTFQQASLALAFTSVIVLPFLAFFFRMTVKWTRVEARLEEIAEDLKRIVDDKDRVHTSMLNQMGQDRQATDRRLRWLEEHLWKRSGGNGAV